jgi:hypothetical protein
VIFLAGPEVMFSQTHPNYMLIISLPFSTRRSKSRKVGVRFPREDSIATKAFPISCPIQYWPSTFQNLINELKFQKKKQKGYSDYQRKGSYAPN